MPSDLRIDLRRRLSAAVRDRDRIAVAAYGRRLQRWTMPKRCDPTQTSRPGLARTWQVVSLALAQVRSSGEYSTLENSERF